MIIKRYHANQLKFVAVILLLLASEQLTLIHQVEHHIFHPENNVEDVYIVFEHSTPALVAINNTPDFASSSISFYEYKIPYIRPQFIPQHARSPPFIP